MRPASVLTSVQRERSTSVHQSCSRLQDSAECANAQQLSTHSETCVYTLQLDNQHQPLPHPLPHPHLTPWKSRRVNFTLSKLIRDSRERLRPHPESSSVKAESELLNQLGKRS